MSKRIEYTIEDAGKWKTAIVAHVSYVGGQMIVTTEMQIDFRGYPQQMIHEAHVHIMEAFNDRKLVSMTSLQFPLSPPSPSRLQPAETMIYTTYVFGERNQ